MKKQRSRFSALARYGVVLAAMILAAGFIVRDMAQTAVVDAPKWNKRASDELSKIVKIEPRRGDILADDGSVLATNMQFHTVWIDFTSGPFREQRLVAALDSLADSLALHFPRRTRDEWKNLFASELKLDKEKRHQSVCLLRGISYSDYLLLRTFPFLNLPNKYHCGIVLESYDRRVNPYGKMARLSIGVVSETKEDRVRRGRWGLERSLDSLLYGKAGTARKIPLTKRMEDWTETPAQDGWDVTTTIDINLQEMLDNELLSGLDYCGAEWGTAILMDVKTGDIKALSNLQLSEDGTRYIEARNRAIERVEPGSVVKTLSMIVALEDGIVNEFSNITTGSSWAYQGKHPIRDTHISASKTPREIISHSSNIGMARIITSRYGSKPGAFYSRLKSMGLFEPMRSGIAGEVIPKVDSLPDNSEGRFALSRQSYGYATEFSPLWTLAIYNAVANGGEFVRPRLVSRLSTKDGRDSVIPPSYIRPRICSEQNARLLRAWLADVITNPQGTGKALKSDLVSLAGKTGTCYVIENSTYNTSAKRLAFCGFFPADEPIYSCIVLVSKPTRNAFGAAGTSGNIFRSVAHKLYARGLLNNSSDYLSVTHTGTRPTLFASPDGERTAMISSEFNLQGPLTLIRNYKPSASSPGAVPDVCGLGLRDAVRILENAGYNVEISGAGYVSSQTPAPGARLVGGRKVALHCTI